MPVSPWAPSTPVVGRNPVAEEPNAKKMVSLVEAMDEEVEKQILEQIEGLEDKVASAAMQVPVSLTD